MDWIVLGIVLALLSLMAFAVKNERHPSKKYSIGDCVLPIPSWWKPTLQKKKSYPLYERPPLAK